MPHEPHVEDRSLSRWKRSVQRTPTNELDERDWAELLAFFRGTYDLEMAGLKGSVASRPYILRVRERASGRLVGTTSFGVAAVTLPSGATARVFHGGDTLVLPNMRGSGLVQEMAVRIVLAELCTHPRTPHYAFGFALSPVMYVGVARSFVDTWPRRNCDMPPEVRVIMDSLGRRTHPETWRSADEPIPVARRGRGDELAVPDKLLGAPDVRFYLEKNPGYAEGMALPFVFKLDARNLAGLCLRSLRKLVRR